METVEALKRSSAAPFHYFRLHFFVLFLWPLSTKLLRLLPHRILPPRFSLFFFLFLQSFIGASKMEFSSFSIFSIVPLLRFFTNHLKCSKFFFQARRAKLWGVLLGPKIFPLSLEELEKILQLSAESWVSELGI